MESNVWPLFLSRLKYCEPEEELEAILAEVATVTAEGGAIVAAVVATEGALDIVAEGAIVVAVAIVSAVAAEGRVVAGAGSGALTTRELAILVIIIGFLGIILIIGLSFCFVSFGLSGSSLIQAPYRAIVA
jgi:hypothetical protein